MEDSFLIVFLLLREYVYHNIICWCMLCALIEVECKKDITFWMS